MSRHAPAWAVILAFLTVYTIWGSTYLAIRFAVEEMPPLLMASARFLVGGALLFVWQRFRGTPAPTARQWRDTFIVGTLLLLGGNGIVCWAEQWVPSGLAALMVASVSLWMVLFAWVAEPRNRPGPRGLVGLGMGFLGVGVLVQPGGDLGSDPRMLIGGASLLLASAFWAGGSIWSRRANLPDNAGMTTSTQMLGGGLSLLLVGSALGEWSRLDVSLITAKSLLSLAYLIVFGAILGFGAYVWLLRVSTPSKVATYAYVNPVVAVLLGWTLAGERLSTLTLAAAAVIVLSVVLITSERQRGGMQPERREPEKDIARGDGAPCEPEQALATD